MQKKFSISFSLIPACFFSERTTFFIAWNSLKWMIKKFRLKINSSGKNFDLREFFRSFKYENIIFSDTHQKLFITFFCWSILTSNEHNMQFFINFSCDSWGSGHFVLNHRKKVFFCLVVREVLPPPPLLCVFP